MVQIKIISRAILQKTRVIHAHIMVLLSSLHSPLNPGKERSAHSFCRPRYFEGDIAVLTTPRGRQIEIKASAKSFNTSKFVGLAYSCDEN